MTALTPVELSCDASNLAIRQSIVTDGKDILNKVYKNKEIHTCNRRGTNARPHEGAQRLTQGSMTEFNRRDDNRFAIRNLDF